MKKLCALALSAVMTCSMFSAMVQADRNEVEAFVTRLYDIALDREPDKAGLDVWTEWLLTDMQCGTSVAAGFVSSPEFQNAGYDNATYVEKLYNMLLDRPSEKDGKAYWVDMLDKGMDKYSVFAGFANSPEFYELCDSYGISAGRFLMNSDANKNAGINSFVTQLYQVCLGRKADMAGQAYWTENLATGASSGIDAVYGFVYSPEFLGLDTTNEEYITALYRVFLDRNPSDDELKVWKSYLVSSELSREDVFNGFSYSPEFAGLCGARGIEVGNLVLEPATYTPDKNGPVATPTVKPTVKPTEAPTAKPTAKPTATPTVKPTVKPTATPVPTATPTPAVVEKQPIRLSGNRKDVITTTENCYAEGNRVRVFFYKGCEVNGDVTAYLDDALSCIELMTNLTYGSGWLTKNFSFDSNSDIAAFYGDTYAGNDFSDEKLNFLVVPKDMSAARSMGNVVILNQSDIQFERELNITAIHEMIHVVNRSNSTYLGDVLGEGYATVISNFLLTDSDIINRGNATSLDNLYSNYDAFITKDNVEKFFLDEPENNWDDYLLGYRFMNFLVESYGCYDYTRLLMRSREMFGDVESLTRAQAVQLTKSLYGEDIYERFVEWLFLGENVQRFHSKFDDSQYRIEFDGQLSTKIKITKYCYTESDSVRIFFYPGITVTGDFVNFADNILHQCEAYLGMKMMGGEFNNPADNFFYGIMDACYGGEFDIPVDFNDGKLNIFVVRDEVAQPYSSLNIVVINEMDLDTTDIRNFALIHETIHSVQMTNGANLGHLMTEGTATAVSRYIAASESSIVLRPEHLDFNYSVGSDKQITAENAEKYFRSEKEDGWEDYCYGYRFCTYLIEECMGTGYVKEMLEEVYKDNGTDYVYLSNDESADYIIKITGNKNIFKDFAEWVNRPENVKRFEETDYDFLG